MDLFSSSFTPASIAPIAPDRVRKSACTPRLAVGSSCVYAAGGRLTLDDELHRTDPSKIVRAALQGQRGASRRTPHGRHARVKLPTPACPDHCSVDASHFAGAESGNTCATAPSSYLHAHAGSATPHAHGSATCPSTTLGGHRNAATTASATALGTTAARTPAPPAPGTRPRATPARPHDFEYGALDDADAAPPRATMYGSDHTYSPYRPSPSPAGYTAGYPGTPSPGGYSPRSPYAGADAAPDWHTTDLEVREDRVVNVLADLLEPVVPQSGDTVKVIAGEDREAVGQLISIENQEGVVKFGTDDIKIMQLRHLCKMSTA
uniref:Spt5 KOW domain-containing protein n=1 Tax=Heliothis virescens TaxID=7102 RepID=A0A2A4K383_HELVI